MLYNFNTQTSFIPVKIVVQIKLKNDLYLFLLQVTFALRMLPSSLLLFLTIMLANTLNNPFFWYSSPFFFNSDNLRSWYGSDNEPFDVRVSAVMEKLTPSITPFSIFASDIGCKSWFKIVASKLF